MDFTVFNLTEEWGKQFRINLQILHVRWHGFALRALWWNAERLLFPRLSPPHAQVEADSCAGHQNEASDVQTLLYHAINDELSELDEVNKGKHLALFDPFVFIQVHQDGGSL